LKNESGEVQRSEDERRRLLELERANVGRYKMFKRGLADNSSGLSTLRYEVIARQEHGRFTHVKVAV
jgi:hypothetical protein